MSTIIAMCIYSFTMSISPGPVNMITLSSSASYGFKRSFAFVSGATIGFTLLLAAIGLGIANLVEQMHFFYQLLKYLGSGFIGYMGYKLIISDPEIELKKNEKLPLFHHGFFIQLLNPKAWIACLSGVSAFNLENSHSMLFIFVTIYFLICYPSLAAWALLGSKMQVFLKLKKNIRIFNMIMGSLLIVTAIYLIFAH